MKTCFQTLRCDSDIVAATVFTPDLTFANQYHKQATSVSPASYPLQLNDMEIAPLNEGCNLEQTKIHVGEVKSRLNDMEIAPLNEGCNLEQTTIHVGEVKSRTKAKL